MRLTMAPGGSYLFVDDRGFLSKAETSEALSTHPIECTCLLSSKAFCMREILLYCLSLDTHEFWPISLKDRLQMVKASSE